MLIKLIGKMPGAIKMNGRIIGFGVFFSFFYLEQIVDALFNKGTIK